MFNWHFQGNSVFFGDFGEYRTISWLVRLILIYWSVMHFLLDPGEGMGHWTLNYAGIHSFITRNLYSLAYMKNKVENRIYLK